MKVRNILAGAAAGVLAAMALVTSATAGPMSSPIVKWDSKCDAAGHVTATFTAPTQATQTDLVFVKVVAAGVLIGQQQLPTPSGAKTVEVDIPNQTGELFALWSNNGSAFENLQAAYTYKWSMPEGCKPAVDVIKPTCKDPYLSVVISNPVGAQPIKLTMNGSQSNTIPGGENDGIVGRSTAVTYVWESTVASLAAAGVKGSGTVEYQPPTGCGAGEPGAKAVTPTEGKRQHGKGRYQHVTPVANAAGGKSSSSSTSASGDSLPVTGANVAMMVGTALLLIGGGVALFFAARRRRVNFTSAG